MSLCCMSSLFLPASFLSFIGILIFRTLYVPRRYSPKRDNVQDFENRNYISVTDEMIKRFKDSINFKTVSFSAGKANYTELQRYADYLINAYPVVHSSPLIRRVVVNNYSILYSITGSDPTLTPYLFSAHLDVVPADGSDKEWISDPFNSQIIDGFLYGRGTLDYKNGVNGMLEALEYALSHNFTPQRSFFLAYGHDEEVGGHEGAQKIAEYLRTEMGLKKLEFVLDEGPQVISDSMKGLTQPFAMVGITEKGYLHAELSVSMDTGHASLPSKESAIGVLAKAIHRLESTPFPSMLKVGGVGATFLEHLSPIAIFPLRLVLCNLWLFSPLVSYMLSKKGSTNAVIRTIVSITSFDAGVKDNVIPPTATARLNHRIHPLQTVKEVIDFDNSVIRDDRVKMRVIKSMESHPVSPVTDSSFGYQTVKASIRRVFPNIVVAPGTMPANTDSRSYLEFTHSVYRFCPSRMSPTSLLGIHGYNERISVSNYEETINFYYNILMLADRPRLSS